MRHGISGGLDTLQFAAVWKDGASLRRGMLRILSETRVARLAVDAGIGARAAEEDIGAWTAVELVIALVAEQQILGVVQLRREPKAAMASLA